MINRLSSLTLSFWALTFLAVWFGLGAITSYIPALRPGLDAMNGELVRDWIMNSAWKTPVAGIWFLGLCAAAGIMVVNLFCCTWTRLIPRMTGTRRGSGRLLVLIHLIMVLVLLGHLSQMAFGTKAENVRLLPGSNGQAGEYRIELRSLEFKDDPALLNYPYRPSRRILTRDTFHPKEDHAEVSVFLGEEQVLAGTIRMLEPLVGQNVRLTLTDFYREGEGPDARVGGAFSLAANPVTTLFLVSYAVWIGLYILLAAFRLKNRNG